MTATASRRPLPTPARAAVAAVTFLTVVPVARRTALDGRDVANGAPLFPVVGAGIGALSGLVAWLCPRADHDLALVAAVAAAAASTLLTGALHLDGLADYADSYGGRSVEDRLRIMRDHTIGTYGASALLFDLLLRVAAFGVVAGEPAAVCVGAGAGALSRASGVVLSGTLPYARAGTGQGAALASSTGVGRASAASAVALVLTLACLAPRVTPIVGAVLATALVLTAVHLSARRRLGGVTGDVLGASSELVEVAVLLVLVISW